MTQQHTIKEEVIASRAVVATNHPLASAAGAEMLARGGNAVDAAVAALFTLSVVEPMMVSPFGAGFFVIRDGRSGALTTIDNYATVPRAATPTMFNAIAGSLDYEVEGKANDIGYRAVATPGALKGWAHASKRFGRLPFAALVEPAMRYAASGFPASAYLVGMIREDREALARFPASAEVFLPSGDVPAVGQTIIRSDYAQTLQQIASEGADTLYTGALARVVAQDMAANGGLVSLDDLANYRVVERAPVRGTYRGYEIVSMGPPSSGGTHIIQMLNLLERFPLGNGDLAFGTPDYCHLLAETLKLAFADRRRYMADPDSVPVPVEALISKGYAEQRRQELQPRRTRRYAPGELAAIKTFCGGETANTTHCTVIDDEGTIVSATQTLNSGFGSKVTVPGTGMLLDNCMVLMDPTPGNSNSIAPGKRVLSSMSPTIVLKNGKPFMALGTPGGKRIFAAVAQAILNVIDHGMTLQQAVEAPRLWTQGAELELEGGFADAEGLAVTLGQYGHTTLLVPKVAGGMNGVLVDDDGRLHGAACWRADGVPIGLSGGPARLPNTSGINP